jgi:uncharacterized membrane protein YfcA
MSIITPRKQYLWVWFLWLAVFYVVWAWLVFGKGQWPLAVAHWPIALAMALGSYVAGSTPMGGGTVGFPVLVLLFKMPATLGRDFSFAIQSIGMVSAAIFIISRRQPLAWSMLKGAMLGAVIGLPFGIFFFAPIIPELWIKLVFAIIWASFGVLHLYRLSEISSHVGMTEFDERWDFRVGLLLGLFASATIVSVTGVGIEMMLYAALVLLCRADLKIAIPSAVVLMGFTSAVGIGIKSLTTGLQPGVYGNWLAAAPVVPLGAPLGALVVNLVGRRPTLLFVAVLCVGQFIWTCSMERAALGPFGLIASVAAVGVCLCGFERLRTWGAVLVGEAKAKHQARRGDKESRAKKASLASAWSTRPG